ncbi:hypothetical protein F4801DRAFT_579041 [Xylaria longipes]|nr:hypothetical protein F4801DRAFT_579041 [Xylaria longipes]RYC55588.1 hypothetical protein CHU98_g10618 [Xylaria longipes]
MSASTTSLASSHTNSSTGSMSVQPSETSTSYFPNNTTVSAAVSTTSAANTPGTPLNDTPSNCPLSPMDREYTKPLRDLDIAQQLSKQPTYWSVQGWVQRTASSRARPVVEDPEAKTRKFEETKRDLLASVGRF